MCFLGGCDFSANKQALFVVCSRHACFVCFWVCCCCCCCCLLLLLSVLHLVCPRWLDFIWAVWRRLDSILAVLGRLDLIWVVCLWICVMTCRLGHWRSWGSGKEDKHRDEIHIPCKDTDVGKEEGVSKRHCTCKLCNSVVHEAHGSLCKFWHEHHHHPGWPPYLHDEMMMLHHLLDCHHTPLCSAPADSMQPPAVVLAEDWTLVQLSWLGKSWPCSPSDVLPDSLASHALLVVSFVASSSQVPSLSPVVAMTLLPQQQQQVPASAVASSLPVVASIAHPERKGSTQTHFHHEPNSRTTTTLQICQTSCCKIQKKMEQKLSLGQVGGKNIDFQELYKYLHFEELLNFLSLLLQLYVQVFTHSIEKRLGSSCFSPPLSAGWGRCGWIQSWRIILLKSKTQTCRYSYSLRARTRSCCSWRSMY